MTNEEIARKHAERDKAWKRSRKRMDRQFFWFSFGVVLAAVMAGIAIYLAVEVATEFVLKWMIAR